MRNIAIILWVIAFGLLAGVASAAQETAAPDTSEDAIGRTPPRLSLVEGEVSFWRPGAEEWVQAQINTPLAPGDQLFAGPDSRMEIQIGGQAFIRGGAHTQIGLESQEPDFIQLKVTAGQASLDLRSIAPGRMVEVDTPNAAFTIETEGYYRLDVGEDRTVFITRRAGRASAILAGGDKIPIGPNAAVTVQGSANPSISSQTAPPLDGLDQWNYARTDRMLEERESGRYVSPETYGIDELDRHGTWRIVPTYGAVWKPRGVAVDWVPYSTGAWMHDPYYGWTWVDTAPWGWAPYHYGRWVRFNGTWCWAPGPRITRPIYAPALVAFFGEPGFQLGIGFAGPVVGWVSLGWGEPLIPWWGRPGFIHRPWWGGWAGPRMVNNRVIHHRTVVNVTEINIYRNARFRNAMVVVGRDHFGRGPISHARIRKADSRHLRPAHAAPRIAATPAGLVPNSHRGVRPPETHLKRSVVSARQHRGGSISTADPGQDGNSRTRWSSPQHSPAGSQRPSVKADTDTRTRVNGRAASPSVRSEGVKRLERRTDIPTPARGPAAPHPQGPARVDKPQIAAPSAPEKPVEAKRNDLRHRSEREAPPPRMVREGDPPAKRTAPARETRVESSGKVVRRPERNPSGPSAPPPAIRSESARPQDQSRGAAPSRIEPERSEPPRGTGDRFSRAYPNASPRQEGPSGSFAPRRDSSELPQRFNRAVPESRQGGRAPQVQNSRPGRAF
ncbi:MAG: hypothetical protein C4519_10405 [Desulfobacteraceae bacterium]|nr:MAG: hypothetical protein C4519_10405 [Desulfobacteraceae bacterium]